MHQIRPSLSHWRAVLTLLLAQVAAPDAFAVCDVIPQPETVFRGATGSVNRVFATAGERIQISVDPAACDSSSFDDPSDVATDFESGTLEGWTKLGAQTVTIEPAGGDPGAWLHGVWTFGQPIDLVAPSTYWYSWASRGVTGFSLDYQVVAGSVTSGPTEFVRLVSGGNTNVGRYYIDRAQDLLPAGVWHHFDVPIDPVAPPPGWQVTQGTWQGLMADVRGVYIINYNFGLLEYGVDNVVLHQSSPELNIATFLFKPPNGLPNAVVVTGAANPCANSTVHAALNTCAAELNGGTVTCVDGSGEINFTATTFSLPLPDTDALAGGIGDGVTLAGPVTVAVAPLPLPCSLATLRCADPGAPSNMRACIDELYAHDGTCETGAVHRHPDFPGLTALPLRNDFQGICDSADPSIPCNNNNANVQLTTDADGNLVVPIDWRGVLVPGTLPIPRLVRAGSSIAAFSGQPPEPSQTPGAPVQVPGLGFLQSFSPKGLRVDPLFNPLFNAQSSETELFGSADAQFGVIRVLRRSPKFRECAGGDRAGLPCIAAFECPASQCVAARCRGGSNGGKQCTGDGMCPGGECGSSLFDFSDRYSAGGTGPVVLSSAEYTAEAQNPAAIDGLVANDSVFMFVRSEPIEGKDLNQDGDQLDDTVVSVRRADDADPEVLGSTLHVGAVGPASPRVHQFPFAFPAVSVEDDVVALLLSEPDDGGDNTGDGDDWDAALRVLRLEPGGAVDVVGASPAAGSSPAADALPDIDRASLTVSDGLVFFRESELEGAPRATTAIPNAAPYWVATTPDARHVAFVSGATSLVSNDTNNCDDVFVLDRDTDADGVFDEPTQTSITRVSVTSSGAQGTGLVCDPPLPFPGNTGNVGVSLSDDGRFVTFLSRFVLDGSPSSIFSVYVHDRDADRDGIFDEDPAVEPGAVKTTLIGDSLDFAEPRLSADGRWLAFVQYGGFTYDVYVRDRDVDQDGTFDEPDAIATVRVTDAIPGGNPFVGDAWTLDMTPDGRFIAFWMLLDAEMGVFAIDRDADGNGVFDEPGQASIHRVSVTTAGDPVAESVPVTFFLTAPAISADGRRIAFHSTVPTAYAAGGNDPGAYLILHDRDADANGVFDEPGGIESRRVPRSQLTRSQNGGSLLSAAAISRDGRKLTQVLNAGDAWVDRVDLDSGIASQLATAAASSDNLTAGYASESASSVYRSGGLVLDGASTLVPPHDLSDDGDQDDVVLAVVDGRATPPPPVSPTVLGPADRVAVAAGNAVFLRPESATGGGVHLNADGDTNDRVVQLWRNHRPVTNAVTNLGLAAERVAISDQVVAALVSEAGEGQLLNGDADMDDWVVYVNDLATATSGSWTSLFTAADAIQAEGPWVAFTVPEAGQGTNLNGDGDLNDRVLRIYNTATHQYLTLVDEDGVPLPGVGPAVDDFVLGDQVVAFRVNEFDQGQNLNGVAPMGGVADGDLFDSVMEVADLATGTVYSSMQAAIPCPVEACDPRIPYRVVGSKVTFLTLEADQGGNDLDQSGDGGTGLVLQHFNPDAIAAGGSMDDANDVVGGTLGGICTSTAEACASDLDCTGGGTCYFPPGGCLLDTGVQCNPGTEDDTTDDCTPSQFCVPFLGLPGQGTCFENQGPCLTDDECTAPAFCTDDGDNPERLFSALRRDPDGRQRFVHEGRCSDGDGACSKDGDCNEGATCMLDVTTTATAADSDGDGLADPIDNCPDVANGDQRDLDGDGIGDACDRQTCGNGRQEYGEGCDHGAQNGQDGVCDATCAYVGPGTACSDGIDNDGDGRIDAGFDLGCSAASDTSERSPTRPCDDGLDNDGDYKVDWPADPGCFTDSSGREDPACSNGIDDDGDGTVDWDGAGYADPDAYCAGNPAKGAEKKQGGCGLGLELTLLLPLLWSLRPRRRWRYR
jgi:WD40-like Beta Propeller Repeat